MDAGLEIISTTDTPEKARAYSNLRSGPICIRGKVYTLCIPGIGDLSREARGMFTLRSFEGTQSFGEIAYFLVARVLSKNQILIRKYFSMLCQCVAIFSWICAWVGVWDSDRALSRFSYFFGCVDLNHKFCECM